MIHLLFTLLTFNFMMQTQIDNSDKSILARGCDPQLSRQFAKVAPGMLGGASYTPTWQDDVFIEQLKTGKWSIVYFAPGACRYSAAKRNIPGGNTDTRGWTLDEYKDLIYELQGPDIQIVETPHESEAVDLLNKALSKARGTK